MAEQILYKREDGKWGWKLLVSGRIVATDGNQGYSNKSDAEDMIGRIISGEFNDADKTVVE